MTILFVLAGLLLAGDMVDTVSARTITSITLIQADPAAYAGQIVTVQGQVYIPSNYQTSTISGFIQEASGRGINVIGSGADVPELQDTGNVVQVTGTVAIDFTTVQILNITDVTLVSEGNPELNPEKLTIGAAAATEWEGTYIEVEGRIRSQARIGTGMNYSILDSSGSIVARVVDGLGVMSFGNGKTIVARGAGGKSGSDFQVLVGSASGVGEPDNTPPTVSSAVAGSPTQVIITFSEALDTATAQDIANYSVHETADPSATITVSSASSGGVAVTLDFASALADGVGYTVVVTGVADLAGNTIAASNSTTFSYAAITILPIATIQANLDDWIGEEVFVRGQVFLPGDYLGVRTSGYIQDGSGRGINVFSFDMGHDILYDIGNIVDVTGVVTLYGTTVEIVFTTISLVSSGNAPLQPLALNSTAQASDSDYEGTYIRVSGEIASITENGSNPVHTNYTITDGTSTVIVRVAKSFGAPVYAVGTTIWASGAGSHFGSDYQILVGVAADITDTEPADLSAPVLMQVYQNAPNQITLRFNEELDPDTATDEANYTINVPAKAAVEVLVASFTRGSEVVLTLSQDIDLDAGWTVSVVGVGDAEGNVIAAPQTAGIEPQPATEVSLDGPINTFLPREGEQYPITMNLLPAMVVAGARTEVSLRIFDMQGRLVFNLYDSRFMPDVRGDFEDASSHVVVWNGRDEYFNLVPAGAYVAYLLVTESTTGKRHQAQMPVVVATRLKR